MTAYTGERWRNARRAALARDDRRCQDCGQTEDLHVHHIKPVREFDNPEDAHFLANLVTLCKYCHRQWEGEYERPVLIDGEQAVDSREVALKMAYETVERITIREGIQEIYEHWYLRCPDRCSRCFEFISHSKKDQPYLRMKNTLTALLAGKTPQPMRCPTADDSKFCDECKRHYRRGSDGSSRHFRIEVASKLNHMTWYIGMPYDSSRLQRTFHGSNEVLSDREYQDWHYAFQKALAEAYGVELTKSVGECDPKEVSWIGSDRDETGEHEEWREWIESELDD